MLNSAESNILKTLLLNQDPEFWIQLRKLSETASKFEDLLSLSTFRKRAIAQGFRNPNVSSRSVRLAFIGGSTLNFVRQLTEHLLACANFACDIFVGEYDNYSSEILSPESLLHEFKPEIVFIAPSRARFLAGGSLQASREVQVEHSSRNVNDVLDLCRIVNERHGAAVIVCNQILPPGRDFGPYSAKSLASQLSFCRLTNLELGLQAPSYVHICDLEYLAAKRGLDQSFDVRGWFESKQLCTPDLAVDIARDVVKTITLLRSGSKKVLVMDLDNTIWGNVIGDDGLNGIELGSPSPRGEAFRDFQHYLQKLRERGILLGVCSKNEHERAEEPFRKHPEMILKLGDISSFKANWNPKSDNLHAIAKELNLGLDSLVFVDDNAAEIEIVRQFAPEVSAIHLGDDPSTFIEKVQSSGFFDVLSITNEDLLRSEQYAQELKRETSRASFTDIRAYLKSLQMKAIISPFTQIDAPRIAQLINKSNQFNLTTTRRSEAEVLQLIDNPAYETLTIRLADKFGDHGLVAVVIMRVEEESLEIDTWLMSCRVLKREVEHETINQIVQLAKKRNCKNTLGRYIPTAKNSLVRDLYPELGFSLKIETASEQTFLLDNQTYSPYKTSINIENLRQ